MSGRSVQLSGKVRKFENIRVGEKQKKNQGKVRDFKNAEIEQSLIFGGFRLTRSLIAQRGSMFFRDRNSPKFRSFL